VPPRWGLQVNPDPATGPEAALITDGTSHWRIRASDTQGDDAIRVENQRIKFDTKIKGSAKDSSIRPDGHGSRGSRAIISYGAPPMDARLRMTNRACRRFSTDLADGHEVESGC
jgi:hypothetical protein